MNQMNKRNFRIWLGLLIALFLGSLGPLDQLWCFEGTGCCDTQKEAGGIPLTPESSHQSPGCSDNPVFVSAFRSGNFRLAGAVWDNFQASHADSFFDAFLWTGAPSDGLFFRAPISVFKSMAFLRTIVLII